MFGTTAGMSASGTPNHLASVAAYWSTAVVGIHRPSESVSSGPPSASVGNVPYVWPPRTATADDDVVVAPRVVRSAVVHAQRPAEVGQREERRGGGGGGARRRCRRRDSRRGRPRRRARRSCPGFGMWRSSALLSADGRRAGRWTAGAVGSNTGCASTPPRLARGPGPDATVRPAMPRDRWSSPQLAGDRLLDRASFSSCPRAGRPRRRASGSHGTSRRRPGRECASGSSGRGRCCGWWRRGLCQRHK